MYLPLIKAVLLEEINLPAHLLNLLAQALEKKLKHQFVNAIGLNFFKVLASASFGISVT
jgi:hypothetical protein